MPTDRERANWARQKRNQRERIKTQGPSQDQEEDSGDGFWTS